jgi:hypothetical protein
VPVYVGNLKDLKEKMSKLSLGKDKTQCKAKRATYISVAVCQ